AAGARVTVMVDGVEQLQLIEDARVGSASGRVRVCIDADAGWHAFGGRVKLGVKRSPLHTAEQVGAFAREIVSRPGLELVGMMAYEAQIAGVGDSPPGHPLRARAVRAMQARSARELTVRRAAI